MQPDLHHDPASPTRTLRVYTLSLTISIFSSLVLVTLAAFSCLKLYHYEQTLQSLSDQQTLLQRNMDKGFAELRKSLGQAPETGKGPVASLYGVDLSRCGGHVTEPGAPGSISFVICRASAGVAGIDTGFAANSRLTRIDGWPLGAYHTYRVEEDPLKQAAHYLSVLGTHAWSDMPPIVDIGPESLSPGSRVNLVHLQKNLLVFLRAIEKQGHGKPVLYTNAEFASHYLFSDLLRPYELWFSDELTVPGLYTRVSCKSGTDHAGAITASTRMTAYGKHSGNANTVF